MLEGERSGATRRTSIYSRRSDHDISSTSHHHRVTRIYTRRWADIPPMKRFLRRQSTEATMTERLSANLESSSLLHPNSTPSAGGLSPQLQSSSHASTSRYSLGQANHAGNTPDGPYFPPRPVVQKLPFPDAPPTQLLIVLDGNMNIDNVLEHLSVRRMLMLMDAMDGLKFCATSDGDDSTEAKS